MKTKRPNNRLSNGWLKLCSEAKRSQLLRDKDDKDDKDGTVIKI